MNVFCEYYKRLRFIGLVIVLGFIGCGHHGFIHDVETALKPWSHEAFDNNPDHFQFVIVSDRAGGHRPGVFSNAARKLNLLRPEFVMSVGDLIEGYTTDNLELTRQWREFNAFVRCFDMPFFYLSGNHDISSTDMAGLWDELFGRRYYYFIYKNVLFLCLNTQETPGYMYSSPDRYLSATQITWAEDVIKRHPDVRWTFVFMHQPLWVYDEEHTDSYGKKMPPRDTGFKTIEKALSEKNYTVFAGHFHQYAKDVRNGRNYYILSTTGGRNDLRGTEFGEFDHGVWVTMTETGPVIANLLIDGILDDDGKADVK